MSARLTSFAFLVALLTSLGSLPMSACDEAESPRATAILIVAPLVATPGTERLEVCDPNLTLALDDAITVLVSTLERTVAGPLSAVGSVVVARTTDATDLAALIASHSPGVLITLDSNQLDLQDWALPALDPADFIDPAEPHHDDRFVLATRQLPTTQNPLDGATSRLEVALASNTRLGRFYAVYELLRRLGARYYHPEDEWLPQVPAAQVPLRLATPTALGPGPVFAPDFVHRSYTFHGAHPLEHLESFSDARHPVAEARNVNDWIIKNRGDLMRGAGRGIAPAADRETRVADLERLRQRRGLRRSTGITLHNQQQGASADLDPTSVTPLSDQVRAVVAQRLAVAPDAYAFGIHFGPTELTTTPDLETVALIDLAGQTALSLRPDLHIEVNNHTSGSQPVDNYDDLGCPPGTNDRGVADYYDLAFHTDPRFTARVHTVMFHPLEGPAPVYNQETFAHKLCLMTQASAAGRPLIYFPESAYWLSWDNAIPVYLPLYLHSRWRDIQLVAPLLLKNGGTLRDHRLFNSGHEWGYWQADYAVGLLHWKSDLPLRSLLGELADPFCDPTIFPSDCPARTTWIDVLTEVMDSQRTHFLDAPDFRGRPGGLYTMFAGEDPADELGAASGLEFRPVRLPFREVLTLSPTDLERFVATDLDRLATLAADYEGWRDRLHTHRTTVPTVALRFYDETIDGLAINAVRARHTHTLYSLAIALRTSLPTAPDVTALLAQSEANLALAETIIRRREAAYRYPAAQTHGGGFTPDTALPNGTTYPFRVHTKTHHLSYWTHRQDQIADLIAGRSTDPDQLALTPVFAAPDTTLTFTWPSLEGLSGELTLTSTRDGTETTIAVGTLSHDLAASGIYHLAGLLETASATLPIGGAVVRTTTRARALPGSFALEEPASDLAASVLASLVPLLRIALDAPPSAPAHLSHLAIAAEPAGPDTASFAAVHIAPIDLGGDAFVSAPFDFALPIPDPSSGRVALTVGLIATTLSGPTIAFTDGGDLLLEGRLSVTDLIDALVTLAGFEPAGAAETLAGVLGFDPANPPDDVPFRATLTIIADTP